MYHLGKVICVYSPADKNVTAADTETQATLSMWDENILTILVDKKISGKVKKGDLVLVDYTLGKQPKATPAPKQVVIKIARGKDAEEAWKEYRRFHDDRKKKAEGTQEKQPPPAQSNYGYIR